MLELACEELDLKVAAERDPDLGGESFRRYSAALKELSALKEQHETAIERVATFKDLVSYLLVSIPTPLENAVVQNTMENAASAEKEEEELVSYDAIQ